MNENKKNGYDKAREDFILYFYDKRSRARARWINEITGESDSDSDIILTDVMTQKEGQTSNKPGWLKSWSLFAWAGS